MFDYFVAALRCSHCGAVSALDSSTDLQTHLRNDVSGREIAVEFQLEPGDTQYASIVASAYLSVGREAVYEAIRLLDIWRCPTCGQESWARISIAGTQVSNIVAVVLDRAELAEAQFISEISSLSAKDMIEGEIDPVKVLLGKLP